MPSTHALGKHAALDHQKTFHKFYIWAFLQRRNLVEYNT